MLFPSTSSAETPKADTHSSTSSDEPPPSLSQTPSLPSETDDVDDSPFNTALKIQRYIDFLFHKEGGNRPEIARNVLAKHQYHRLVVAHVLSLNGLRDSDDMDLEPVTKAQEPSTEDNRLQYYSEIGALAA